MGGTRHLCLLLLQPSQYGNRAAVTVHHEGWGGLTKASLVISIIICNQEEGEGSSGGQTGAGET